MIINLIKSKEVDLINGNLNAIDSELFSSLYPMKQIFEKKVENEDADMASLVHYQCQNIKDVIDLAKSNLIFSCGKYVRSLSKNMYKATENNSNLNEKLSGDFILNSIIYYNASFDYIKILLRLIYASNDELKDEYKKVIVEKEMGRLSLDNSDWFLALGSLITNTKREKFNNWLLYSPVSKSIKDKFTKLENGNKELRKKYQASRLKHGAVPCFKKTDRSNVMGSRYLISLDQFYNPRGKRSMIIGFSDSNSLKIDKTQEFLIDYHNITVHFLNLLSLNEIK